MHLPVAITVLCAVGAVTFASASDGVSGSRATSDSGARLHPDVFSYRRCLRPQIDLNGTWDFLRDRTNTGRTNGFHRGAPSGGAITIPGAPQAQGVGEPNYRQKTHFLGPFWVRRSFELPAIKPDERVWLRLGGIFPAGEVYLNGELVGYTKSSRTQQRVDVTEFVTPGAANTIAIRVCEFPEVRLDGLWDTEEFSLMWTGVYGPVACEIANRVSLVDLYTQPRLADSAVDVSLTLAEPADAAVVATVRALDGERELGSAATRFEPGAAAASCQVALSSFETWGPEHPTLYDLEVELSDAATSRVLDRSRIRFGMREIRTEGNRFYLNGKPLFVRCFGENQYYPETLVPPVDIEWYLPRLKQARACGLNAVKSCVEALPQAYVEAADEAGIMIIQEMPFGLSGLRANRYTIDQRFREYYSAELDGLIRTSRNHASVIAYSMSSEQEFSNQTQESFDFFSRDLIHQARALAPHALMIDCTGYVYKQDTEKGRRETDFYASIMPAWIKEVLVEPDMPTDGLHPTILHEYNWWSCYPDPADRAKYATAQMKPYWLDTLERTAAENGQEHLLPTYRRNSLWLQELCRKDGIEYARRNPAVEGYILWLLIDFGQYTEGVFDDFWGLKPNACPEKMLQYNADTVIVLAQEGNRCLRTGEVARIPLAISQYGEDDYGQYILQWQLAGEGLDLRGELPVASLPQGQLTQAGAVECALPERETGYALELHVTLTGGGKAINTNQWSFWAFAEPKSEAVQAIAAGRAGSVAEGICVRIADGGVGPIPAQAQAVIADRVDEELARYVEQGGRCLLLSSGSAIEYDVLYAGFGKFNRTFRTIPWNAGVTGNSGTVIADHPALAGFPHEEYCDLQFVALIRDIAPLDTEPLRQYGVEPVIRSIDHYATNHNKGYMVEFRVGAGSVLATSLGILPHLGERIEARALLGVLAQYVRSEAFAPAAQVPMEQFVRLLGPKAPADAQG